MNMNSIRNMDVRAKVLIGGFIAVFALAALMSTVPHTTAISIGCSAAGNVSQHVSDEFVGCTEVSGPLPPSSTPYQGVSLENPTVWVAQNPACYSGLVVC